MYFKGQVKDILTTKVVLCLLLSNSRTKQSIQSYNNRFRLEDKINKNHMFQDKQIVFDVNKGQTCVPGLM